MAWFEFYGTEGVDGPRWVWNKSPTKLHRTAPWLAFMRIHTSVDVCVEVSIGHGDALIMRTPRPPNEGTMRDDDDVLLLTRIIRYELFPIIFRTPEFCYCLYYCIVSMFLPFPTTTTLS